MQGGILLTGSIASIGVIPPKKTMYSSSVYQIRVDPEIAPNGVKVYGFSAHMHALGKKLWIEKLKRISGHKKGILQKFDYLDKACDSAQNADCDCGYRC